MNPQSPEFLELLRKWEDAAEKASRAKAKENDLRAEVAEILAVKDEGTSNIKLPGVQVKLVVKYNRSLDQAALESVFAQMREKKLDPTPYVRWKPDLAVAVYKKASPEVRGMLDAAITTTPGTPTLSLKWEQPDGD